MRWVIIVLLIPSLSEIYAQQKISSIINLKNSVEYAPSISADGNTLIYQSNRDGKFKLHLSTKNSSGEWGIPVSLDNINDFGKSNDLIGGPTVSYDGNVLYFFATFENGHGNEDIWYSIRDGDDFGEPINLGKTINTGDYEGFPSISSDGNKIYFMRGNKTQKLDGAFCYSIWMSERNALGEWQKPTLLPAPINLGCEKSPRIMSDNEMLIFASIREGGLGTDKFDLYYSRLDNEDEWGTVKPLDYINTPDDELFAAVPACGDVLYFVGAADLLSDSITIARGGFRDLDLFSSPMTEESKPKPAILIQGNLIDSESGEALFGEISIVKNENKDKRGVLLTNKATGGFTLVLTKGNSYKVGFNVPGYQTSEVDLNTSTLNQCAISKRDIKLNKWKGYYAVKTKDRANYEPLDVSVTITNNSTNTNLPMKRRGIGDYVTTIFGPDEYTVSISGACINDSTYTFTPMIEDIWAGGIDHELKFDIEDPRLKLRIINKETKEEIANAVLLAVDAKTRKALYRNVLQGDTTLNIDCTGTYVMLGVAANYFSDRQVLDASKSDTRGLIEMDLELVELKPGAKLVTTNITFDTNSAALKKGSYAEIDQVISVLKRNAHIKVEIAAHTDDIGSPEDNTKLSEQRAETVLNYMLSKGIDVNRLISKGYGESSPTVANTSRESRAMNRRVEFIIPKTNVPSKIDQDQ